MYETNRGEDSAEMTDLQFAFTEYQKICVERDALREENRALRKEGSVCDESCITDYQFKAYVDLRDKCEAQSREIILLREENAKLKMASKS
jgi:hypothetical protein